MIEAAGTKLEYIYTDIFLILTDVDVLHLDSQRPNPLLRSCHALFFYAALRAVNVECFCAGSTGKTLFLKQGEMKACFSNLVGL